MPRSARRPSALCPSPCNRVMRGDKEKCGKCLAEERHRLKLAIRRTTAPVRTNIDKRTTVIKESTRSESLVARDIIEMEEANQVRQTNQLQNQEIFARHAEFSSFIAVRNASQQIINNSLRIELENASRRQQARLTSSQETRASAAQSAGETSSEQRVTDVSDQLCQLEYCENRINLELPCAHKYCDNCISRVIRAAFYHDNGNIRSEPRPLKCSLCRSLFTHDQLVRIEVRVQPEPPALAERLRYIENLVAQPATRVIIAQPDAPLHSRMTIEDRAANSTQQLTIEDAPAANTAVSPSPEDENSTQQLATEDNPANTTESPTPDEELAEYVAEYESEEETQVNALIEEIRNAPDQPASVAAPATDTAPMDTTQ